MVISRFLGNDMRGLCRRSDIIHLFIDIARAKSTERPADLTDAGLQRIKNGQAAALCEYIYIYLLPMLHIVIVYRRW